MKVLPEGQYVKHSQYGFGTVTASDAERTSIDFDLHGMKKFVTSLMEVELSGEELAKRPRVKRSKKTAAKARSSAN